MRPTQSRRNFLRTAPIAAAAGITLANAAPAQAQAAPLPFQHFSATTLADDAKALEAKPGNNNLVDIRPRPSS